MSFTSQDGSDVPELDSSLDWQMKDGISYATVYRLNLLPQTTEHDPTTPTTIESICASVQDQKRKEAKIYKTFRSELSDIVFDDDFVVGIKGTRQVLPEGIVSNAELSMSKIDELRSTKKYSGELETIIFSGPESEKRRMWKSRKPVEFQVEYSLSTEGQAASRDGQDLWLDDSDWARGKPKWGRDLEKLGTTSLAIVDREAPSEGDSVGTWSSRPGEQPWRLGSILVPMWRRGKDDLEHPDGKSDILISIPVTFAPYNVVERVAK